MDDTWLTIQWPKVGFLTVSPNIEAAANAAAPGGWGLTPWYLSRKAERASAKEAPPADLARHMPTAVFLRILVHMPLQQGVLATSSMHRRCSPQTLVL